MKDAWPEDAALVVWEGDSREVLKRFPARITQKLGQEIMRLQVGAKPLSYRPMPSIGKGVYELRQRDDRGWYRVIYLRRVGNCLYMLHSLVKKSAKTPPNDIKIATTRLRGVRSRLEEEKDG